MYKLNTSATALNYILTNTGYKPPKDVIYNDKIYDIHGRPKSIKNIISKTNKTKNPDLMNFISVYTDYTLQVNVSNHYMFMVKYVDPRLPLSDMFDILQSEEHIRWVHVDQLHEGHYLALTLDTTQHKKVTVPIVEGNTVIHYKLNHSRLWFLLGYFLHYGVFETQINYKNCILLTIYDQKEEELLNYLDEFIDFIPTIFSNGLNDACVYRIQLHERTFQILSHLIDKKSIPEWIHSGSRFYLHSFIHGFLYNVHGIHSTYNKNSFMYTWTIKTKEIILKNINIELLLSLQLILFKCDIINAIQSEDRKNYSIHRMIIYKEKKENQLYPFFNQKFIWIPFKKKEYISEYSINTTSHILNNDNNTCIVNNIIMKYVP